MKKAIRFRFFSLRAAMMLLAVMLTSLSSWADEGSCGENVTYTYEGNTLTISGSGAMQDYVVDVVNWSNDDYEADTRPWKYNLGDIEYVVIKKGVTHIGNNAFARCTYLKSVSFEHGSQLTSIGNYAFYKCDYEWKSISIPASVTSIGNSAFANCSELANITVCAENPPTLGTDAFAEISSSAVFTVPNEDAYKDETSDWKNFNITEGSNFNIDYIDANGEPAVCPYATPLTSSDSEFECSDEGDLWFYVDGEVTITSDMQFSAYDGSANIILCDGAKLTVGYIYAQNNLNIYGQENHTGEIEFNVYRYAAIDSYGDLTINGGIFTINNADDNCTAFSSGGNFTINGGTITVDNAGYGFYPSGNLTINGGTIEVTNAVYNGINLSGGDITINGGNITVSSNENYAYVIYSSGGININGGVLSATATGQDAIGICAGSYITLAGGTITASSYEGSVIIAEDFTYSDGAGNTYSSGALTADINNKTLTPQVKTVTLFAAGTTNLWMTWCDKDAYVKPEGVTVFTVSGVNEGEVTTAEVSGSVIPAYTPVLLYRSVAGSDAVTASFKAKGTAPTTGYDAESGIVETTLSTDVTILGNTSDDAYTSATNNNVFATSENGDYVSYVLYKGNFLAVDTDGGIAAHRCWLNIKKSTSNGARSLSILTDGETTGIVSMDNGQWTIDNYPDDWFTLDGRKLQGVPTQKGVYINNGKKYMIK